MSRKQIIRQTIYLCLGTGCDVGHVARLLHVSVKEVKEIANGIAKFNPKK